MKSKDCLKFRPATIDDADLLLRWRNDQQTRRSSKNIRVVSMKQHIIWLKSSLKNKKRKIYIAERGRAPVGTIRTDYSNGTNELSWTVAPEVRRQGVGKEMVALFANKIGGPLRAEIKVGNEASKHIAEYAGMKFIQEENGILHYVRQ